MLDRSLPFLRFLFALSLASSISFSNTGLAGVCEAEKDPFPDETTDVGDGSECPPGSSPGAAAKEQPKDTSTSPAPDPFPDPSAVDNGSPPPLSAGGAGEGSGDAWNDSETGDGSGR